MDNSTLDTFWESDLVLHDKRYYKGKVALKDDRVPAQGKVDLHKMAYVEPKKYVLSSLAMKLGLHKLLVRIQNYVR